MSSTGTIGEARPKAKGWPVGWVLQSQRIVVRAMYPGNRAVRPLETSKYSYVGCDGDKPCCDASTFGRRRRTVALPYCVGDGPGDPTSTLSWRRRGTIVGPAGKPSHALSTRRGDGLWSLSSRRRRFTLDRIAPAMRAVSQGAVLFGQVPGEGLEGP